MADSYTPSDAVNIISLTLSSLDGSRTYDLTPQVFELSIYEDIMFPVVRGEFTMIDSIDLLGSFPIIGEEIITVEFGMPGSDVTNSYTLFTKTIDNQVINESAKSKTYVIRAYSSEFMTSAKQFVTSKLSGNTDDLVRSMCKDYLKTQKQLLVEPTKGTQSLLISRLRPLQAIDMMRKRDVSAKYLSS